MQLKDNEGLGYEKDVSLLFAASGEMRNMVKTLAEVPEQLDGKISVVLNDKDFDVVAPNAILLLISLMAEDKNQAAECMTHIWYSAFVTEKQVDLLTKSIRPLIEDVNEKIKDKSSTSPHAKTFHFGTRSLRFVLKKSDWKALLVFLAPPKDLTAERLSRYVGRSRWRRSVSTTGIELSSYNIQVCGSAQIYSAAMGSCCRLVARGRCILYRIRTSLVSWK